ncbi:11089_t:CDS:2 [Funneliformis caledonium]|uniref:11089_t:CDS:1 n=1 Tax=Funneliformis caledonium TaxID=1117310 RepID=A0A9N9AK44_9GLOM|nr:11089_t:CDS:2 [Funneliformis caledonium]
MRLVGTVKSHIQLGNYFYNPYSKHMEIQLYACKSDISPLPHGQVQIDTISEMTSNLHQTFPSLCTSNHHATLHHVGQSRPKDAHTPKSFARDNIPIVIINFWSLPH